MADPSHGAFIECKTLSVEVYEIQPLSSPRYMANRDNEDLSTSDAYFASRSTKL